jgi:hypothetical protein
MLFGKQSRRPASRRLHLEALEDRLAPAIFTVTTPLDFVDATGRKLSLRAAVSKANVSPGPDIIMLPAGVFRISLVDGSNNDNAGGDFDVTETVTIIGQGAGVTVIDGGGSNRLFDVIGKFDVAFRGLTLRNGGGQVNGAAIQALDANLKLTGCVI